jgi:hypothetical protein
VARAEGHSWAAIGAMLGTFGEAARQRYGTPAHQGGRNAPPTTPWQPDSQPRPSDLSLHHPCPAAGKMDTLEPASSAGQQPNVTERMRSNVQAAATTRADSRIPLNTRVIRVAPVFSLHTLGWC